VIADLVVAVALAPAVATADPDPGYTREVAGNTLASLELSAVHDVSSGIEPPIHSLSLASGHISTSYGGSHHPRLRYYMSLDVALGVATHGLGFAYDAQWLPLGFATDLGTLVRPAFVAVAIGAGASGAPAALPTAGAFPIQLHSVVRVSETVSVMARARAVKLLSGTIRSHGAPSASFADELDGILAVQLGHADNYLDANYVGLAYRELGGARFVGIVVGKAVGEEDSY
jgi:hypothetical protein